MEEIENAVYLIIGKKSKTYLVGELGISRPTLERRLKNGGWKKNEVIEIRRLTEKEVQDAG